MRCKRIRRLLAHTRACAAIGSEAETKTFVSERQSAVLYDAATSILGGIGEIAAAFGRGDWRGARSLRSELDPLLRLLDDLGWSGDAQATAITMASGELHRALAAISAYAVESIAAQMPFGEDAREASDRLTAICSTCTDLHRQLATDGAS
jgi:hypothetical protein